MKDFISIFLILILMLNSFGLTIFRHFCSEDRKTEISLFHFGECCEKEKFINSCCEKKTKAIENVSKYEKTKCCSIDAQTFQIGVFHILKQKLPFNFIFSFIDSFFRNKLIQLKNDISFFTVLKVPPEQNRALWLLMQVFRL